MDLNQDGFQDIITGQYHPGEVTWFRGSEKGFLPGVKLEQEGNPAANGHPDYGNYDGEPGDIGTFDYWVYSSASFGDLTGDGLDDLVVGGDVLRISANIGSKSAPKFAERELLLDLNGEPLRMALWSESDIAEVQAMYGPTWEPGPSGTAKMQPLVVDWDGDGVLDILSTDHYTARQSMAVAFFKGVKTKDGHRFQQGVDLLSTKDGVKALPGSGARVFVADWNKDGVKDLIVGASVATVNGGEFSDELSWEWESVNKVESAGKDPGRYPPREKPTFESMKKQLSHLSDEQLNKMLPSQVKYWEETIGKLHKEGKGHWETMRHQGRIYVFLGKN